MPFRDEKEAAAARIEALEAELREEREKRAELEKRLEGEQEKPREEPSPSSAPPLAPGRGMSRWKKVALGALGVGAVLGGCEYWQHWHDLHAQGELRHVHVAEFADGRPALVVADRVEQGGDSGPDWHERLDVVDPLQGRRTARVMAPDLHDCVPAARGFAWCVFDHALELREIAGLHAKRTNDDLVALVPALAKGTHETPFVDPHEHELFILTNDGQRHRFAADGSHATLVSSAPTERLDAIDSDFRPSKPCDRHAGDAVISLVSEGTPRARLARTIGNGEPMILGNDDFLDAKLVCDDTRGKLVGIDHGIAVVVHSTALDAHDVMLSGVSLDDGKVRWSAGTWKGKLHAAWTFGDGRVVVAIESDSGEILALGLDDGQIAWVVPT